MPIFCSQLWRAGIRRPALLATLLLATLLLASGLMAACATGRAAPASIAPATGVPPTPNRALDVSNATSRDPQTYSAEIVPTGQVSVVAEVAGQVIEVSAQLGDHVSAGDILLRLDSTTLAAQRAQALAALQVAQAELELLRVVAGDADIEAARAAVAAAEAAYQRALSGPSTAEIAAAQARLRQAEAAVKVAQAAYNQVAWNPAIATLPESLHLEQARLDLDAAQTAYDQLTADAQTGPRAGAVADAYAQLAAARAHLQRLEDGAQPAQIQAAEAEVRQAETALYLAQLQLDKATLRAPVSGIVAQMDIAAGAMVAPGVQVARLITPEVKVVISVDEARLSQVHAGQAAAIQVSAYPGESFPGVVTLVAPTADPATHTVPVTIQPTGDATRLLPGMLATVRLAPEQPPPKPPRP